MDLVHPDIDRYLRDLSAPSDPVLQEMERLGEARRFPIVGRQVGRLLRALTLATGARRVLELGSGFGYSAYWFAGAVGPGGEVVLTDRSPERAEEARSFLARGGLLDRARIEVGDSLEIAARLDPPFDIVFNDIDKERYPLVPDVARRLLRPGGLLVSDNMLWSGRVLDPSPSEAATRGVQVLTRLLYEAGDFAPALLPVRDGVVVAPFLGPAAPAA